MQNIRIGIVAIEASGDQLGAQLIQALQKRYPSATFFGCGGDAMQKCGMQLYVHSREIEAFGLLEVIPRIPKLFRMRRMLATCLHQADIDVFIGIDASSFNGAIEKYLYQHGVACIHYVCPTVWAWRSKRAIFFARIAKMVLCLYPIETAYIRQAGGKALYVGHPLADAIPFRSSTEKDRQKLKLQQWIANRPVVGVFAGSRRSEIARTLPIYGKALAIVQNHQQIQTQQKDGAQPLAVIISVVDIHMHALVTMLIKKHFQCCDYRIIVGQTRSALSASNVVLATSGTITLEAMLMKKPMVIAYKANSISYWIWSYLTRKARQKQRGLLTGNIITRTSKKTLPLVGLPNLLAEYEIVPECIQKNCTPSLLAHACLDMLTSNHRQRIARFYQLHRQLKQNTIQRILESITPLLAQKKL